MSGTSFETCARCIQAAGLAVRGAFHVQPGDEDVPRPDGYAGVPTVILIGNAGSGFWPAFRASQEYRDGRPDPLDRWSERVISGLGRRLDAHAVFPFKGPPYYPFQKWARRGEALFPSPLGILIHREYGLWHAYRGALIVNRRLPGLPARVDAESPCLSCDAQPCLHACPVDAFRAGGFDADGCAAHLSGANECTENGCRARLACPAGKAFEYMREEHRFHLAAFLRARANDGTGSAS